MNTAEYLQSHDIKPSVQRVAIMDYLQTTAHIPRSRRFSRPCRRRCLHCRVPRFTTPWSSSSRWGWPTCWPSTRTISGTMAAPHHMPISAVRSVAGFSTWTIPPTLHPIFRPKDLPSTRSTFITRGFVPYVCNPENPMLPLHEHRLLGTHIY